MMEPTVEVDNVEVNVRAAENPRWAKVVGRVLLYGAIAGFLALVIALSVSASGTSGGGGSTPSPKSSSEVCEDLWRANQSNFEDWEHDTYVSKCKATNDAIVNSRD